MRDINIIGLFLVSFILLSNPAFAGLLDPNTGPFGDGGPCGVVNCGADGNMNSGADTTVKFSDGSMFVRKNQQGKFYDKNGITDCVYNYRKCAKKMKDKAAPGTPPAPNKPKGGKGKKGKKKAKDNKSSQNATTSSANSGKRAKPHVGLRKGDARRAAAHLRKKP